MQLKSKLSIPRSGAYKLILPRSLVCLDKNVGLLAKMYDKITRDSCLMLMST